MFKCLRSRIDELFPEDMQMDIMLLSQRRDIKKKEKREEILNIFRRYEIPNVVPLGNGTNRYGLKVDGFACKVATDNDGIVDNRNEMKYGKRLYPKIPQAHEISPNGTLFFAEYVQPFTSYSEMILYRDQIEKILRELKSSFLIGDVGISSNNWANWGLRVGTNQPVILDYAYIYPVNSSVVLCRNCNTGSPLDYTDDFNELYCTNPKCNAKYKFSTLRGRISRNELNQFIGDLTDEAYFIEKSNQPVELDLKRSSYLIKKLEKEKSPPVDELEENSSNEEIQEETEMAITNERNIKKDFGGILTQISAPKIMPNKKVITTPDDGFKGIVLHGTLTAVNKANNVEENVEPISDEMSDKMDEDNSSVLAFEADIDESDDASVELEDEDDCKIPDEHKSRAAEINQAYMQSIGVNMKPVAEENTKTTEEPAIVIQGNVIIENGTKTYTPEADVHNESFDKPKPSKKVPSTNYDELVNTIEQDEKFREESYSVISTLANTINQSVINSRCYDDAREYLGTEEQKLIAGKFYRFIQNAIFRSLVVFCHFTESEAPNPYKPGTHKEWRCAKSIKGEKYLPTLIFIYRLWKDDLISLSHPDTILKRYNAAYGDYKGIQEDWLKVFKDRLQSKLNIEDDGVYCVSDVLKGSWVTTEKAPEPVKEPEPPKDPDPVPPVLPEATEEVITVEEVTEEKTEPAATESFSINIEESEEVESEDTESDDEENEEDSEDESEEEDDEDDGDISVEIHWEKNFDVVKVTSNEPYGKVLIPIYGDLGTTYAENEINIIDRRNGVWEFLSCFRPAMMFRTKDPEKWLRENVNPIESNQSHIIILDADDKGNYIMGIYYVEGIWEVSSNDHANLIEDPLMLSKVNNMILKELSCSNISHLKKSLTMQESIHDEEYIESCIVEEGYDSDVDDGDDEESDEELTDYEKVALNAITGGNEGTDINETVAKNFDRGFDKKEEKPSPKEIDKTLFHPIAPKTITASTEEEPQNIFQTVLPMKKQYN